MFDPLIVGGVFIGWQLLKKSSANTHFGVVTPEREEMFNNALEHLTDPERLRKLADAFEKEGLRAQANVLRRRATWRERDAKTKADHEAIFQKALESENAVAILEVANAFELMTATVKARQLRDHVALLRSGKFVKKQPEKEGEKQPDKVIETKAEPSPNQV